MSNRIILKNVSKSFGNQEIIKNINLTLHQGEIVSIIGDNGSGKSTILKMISGLIYQDQGEITVFGIDNKSKKNLETCEFVIESGQGYYGYLSAYENARYFFGLNKVKFKTIEEDFYELCERLNFMQHLHKKVDALSQGNRQKLSLIVSLLLHPKVLLLDEPTNGLDQESIHIFSELLLEAQKRDYMTIIMTSHDTPFMKSIHSRVIQVKDKQIIFDAPIENYQSEEVELYRIHISNKDYDLFKQQYPDIKMIQNKDFFTISITKSLLQDILSHYDVLELFKVTKED